MKKAEILKALEFLLEQKKTFTNWIIEHPTHPYVSTIAQDVRHFEGEENKLLVLYSNPYPTLADVKALKGKELMLVFRGFAKPKTIAEEEVYNYVSDRIKQY